MTSLHPISPRSLLTTLALIVGLGAPASLHARPAADSPPTSQRHAKVTFVPKGKKAPKRTSGGASRGRCPQDPATASLAPLIPSQAEALTISERPTLFAYVPPTTAQQLFVSLQRVEDGHNIYYESIPITEAGVMAIQLPATAEPLDLNQRYRWSLSLACNGSLDPNHPPIMAEVKRIPMDAALVTQLAQQSPLEQATLLAQAGIWYDTLAHLVQSRQANPENVAIVESWQKLLQTTGLESVATAPLLDGTRLKTK